MLVTQVCAYANWPKESFEVWKWVEGNKPSKEIQRSMTAFFIAVFAQVIKDKAFESLEAANCTIGGSYEAVNVPKRVAEELIQFAAFTYSKGRCLEPERLQYFSPSRVLLQGVARIQGDEVTIKFEKPVFKKPTRGEKEALSVRELLGDDPKRIESDRSRMSLGLPWDNLFSWKESFAGRKSNRNGL